MRNSLLLRCLLVAALLPASAGIMHSSASAAAKRKGGPSRLTPSARAGIPPEAFGSPVRSPDSTRWAWIADLGKGPNVFVGSSDRKRRLQVTRYVFTPANDLMPGMPLLWSPDGRNLAYFEYSHRAASPLTSSKAVIVPADGSAPPRRIQRAGSTLNTTPQRWLDAGVLRFKALMDASMSAPQEAFVYVLSADTSGTEAAYLAALRAQADSAAARAARAAAAAAAPTPGRPPKK